MSLIVALSLIAVLGEEDLLGASSQELEEVLALSPEQKTRLGEIQSWGRDEEQKLKDKPGDELAKEHRKLRAAMIDKVLDMLSDKQKFKVDAYMSRKMLFEDDRVRFTMGVPSLSELRIHVGISDAEVRKVAPILDEHVEKTREAIKDAKARGTSKKDLAVTLARLRDSMLQTLQNSIETKTQPALQKFLAETVTPYEARLDPSSRNKLGRLCGQLGGKEPLSETRKQDCAKILWHQEEIEALRKSMMRDVGVKSKNPEEAWTRTYEFSMLLSIHRYRLERLQRELQSAASLKEQLLLIHEGLIPG